MVLTQLNPSPQSKLRGDAPEYKAMGKCSNVLYFEIEGETTLFISGFFFTLDLS